MKEDVRQKQTSAQTAKRVTEPAEKNHSSGMNLIGGSRTRTCITPAVQKHVETEGSIQLSYTDTSKMPVRVTNFHSAGV